MLNRTSWSSVVQKARNKYTPDKYLNAIPTVQADCCNFSLNLCYKAKSQADMKKFSYGFLSTGDGQVKNPLTSSEPSLGFIGLALSSPMTVPWSVFQCSLWTSPNKKSETHWLRSRRSFSRQILKVLPWNRHSLPFQLSVKEHWLHPLLLLLLKS